MNANGQSFLRKAMRLLGAGVPLSSLASDELFCIRPGAAAPMVMAYGPMGGDHSSEDRKPYHMEEGGIAVIPVVGVLSEYPSLFRIFGCSDQPTLGELREATLRAAADSEVAGIMLYVKSPGGTHAGTPQFAEAVAEAAKSKPVHAYAENMCCSAGYWPASQANRLTAHRSTEIGGIGVFSILLDASEAAATQGLKFHVISTGPFKGAGAEPGAGLSPEQLEYFQTRANDAGEIFFGDVAMGRSLALVRVRELADGRCHIASRAVSLGLCDGVGTYAAALEELRAAIQSPPQSRPVVPPSPPEPMPDEEPPPEDPGIEEEAMSEKTKPDATAAAATEEDIGLLAKLRSLFSSESKESAAAVATPAASAAQPAALSVEDIDARVSAAVEQRLQAADVDRDLKALEGRVPPATLNSAENRALLLEAKAKGPERYKAALALIAGQNASALLGGPIAAREQTGEAPAGLGVNAKELEMLKQLGMSAEEVGSIERKYQLKPSGLIVN